jgi:hypothetical protein
MSLGVPWRTNASPADPVRTEADAKDAIALVASVLAQEGVKVGAIGFQEARTADLILRARKRALDLRREQNQLVDRAETYRALCAFWHIERNALQNWIPRKAPEVAVALGVDQVLVEIVLERLVREFLEEQSAPPKINLKGKTNNDAEF